MAQNTLYYGDNLDILRRYVKDETVDLVYLDPPFNSNATYNILFAEYDAAYLEAEYKHVEQGTRRRYSTSDLTAAKPGGDTEYEWKGVRPYSGRYWAYSKENMEQFEREGRLHYRSTGMPRLKHSLDEMPGVRLQDIWDDIAPISAKAQERLGYPTQKPEALLERIISASSNGGPAAAGPSLSHC